MNVLIVEDNAFDRKLLRHTLEHHDCTVIEARDGEEGLDLAIRHHPDIIVSDALMPRMDGFQLLRALKADPYLKSIPFLFYSATYTGEQEEKLALSLGAEAFVVKPTEPEELWEKTCAIMKAWEARQRIPAHLNIVESEEEYLREYGRIVATKLEKKVRELEEALAPHKQAEDDLRRLNAELTREISERKQAEEEKAKLEAQNRQIQKAESLARMAGAIAHHFNNQLAAVIGNLELAMFKLPPDAAPLKNLDRAMQAANRAAEVSGQMLTYLGQTPGIREPLDLSETCRRSLPMLRAAISKELLLESDLPSPGPVISANPNKIQLILINLVTNAWEAGGERRGAIHLAVKKVSPTDIPAANRFPIDWQPRDNDYACLEVADAGCGIADEDIEKLFDPFFSSKFPGRGLGLPVVLGIVRVHGGAVTVQSGPGRGSAFRVFLPLSEVEAPRKADKAAQAPEIEGGGMVLLVENEERVRSMAADMLTLLNFTVLEAQGGVEAVELFRRHKDEIRCVLCNLTMPRMDGWETLAALRKITPGIPVILVSGYDESQVMTGDHPEWPQAFLSKPYLLEELRDALGRTLAKTKSD
ncbi:MAG TPA: response regulator [Geobacteraceae bacterium]|nr:response regulator [Geobacteraceae bacterium]